MKLSFFLVFSLPGLAFGNSGGASVPKPRPQPQRRPQQSTRRNVVTRQQRGRVGRRPAPQSTRNNARSSPRRASQSGGGRNQCTCTPGPPGPPGPRGSAGEKGKENISFIIETLNDVPNRFLVN